MKADTNSEKENLSPIWSLKNLGGTWEGDPEKLYEDDLWQDTIPMTGVGLLTGMSGAYKTFNALRLCLALSRDSTFLGRAINRNGGTIYLAYEGHESVRPRLDALIIDEGLDHRTVKISTPSSVELFRDGKSFDELELAIEEARAEYRERFGVDLVFIVVDTLIASGMLKDENDPIDWQWVITQLKDIALRQNIAIGLVVHAGKDASKGARGSSGGYSGVDFELSFTCYRDNKTGETGGRLVSVTKVRDGGKTGPLAAMSIKTVEVGQTRMGRLKSAGVIQYDMAPTAINAAIAEQEAFAAGRRKGKIPAAENPESRTFKDLLERRNRRRKAIFFLYAGRFAENVTREGKWEVICSKDAFDAVYKADELYETIGKNKKRVYESMMLPKKRRKDAEGEPEPPELVMDSSGKNFILTLPSKPAFVEWDTAKFDQMARQAEPTDDD